jgi:hypothetical protein
MRRISAHGESRREQRQDDALDARQGQARPPHDGLVERAWDAVQAGEQPDQHEGGGLSHVHQDRCVHGERAQGYRAS